MSKVLRIPIYRYMSTVNKDATNLKSIVASKIIKEQERIKKFRKEYGNTKVGDVTVNMIYGGMREIKGLVCETSLLDPEEGIKFRGFTIPELQQKLPKASKGNQPLPEGIFWLMLTGDLPTESQTKWLSAQWAERSFLPDYITKLLNNLPSSLHPMAQLSCGITSLHRESKFNQAYKQGISKTQYWEYVFEDAMNLISKITLIAAQIFRNTYRNQSPICKIDPTKDWAFNYTKMLGFEDKEMVELIRLYLMLHCDHEGGNVTAHTSHLVGSALSDCYLAYAAGVNGLAGPLHGLANQETLMWLKKIQKELGNNIPESVLESYIQNDLKSGKIIPGYGHAVLRRTDPRFLCLREFAQQHLPNDPLFQLCSQTFKIVPSLLKRTGKVQNPWPNIDAHSGVLLQYYGLQEMEFYTVMFAVSRVLGVMASLVWDRALGLPIERPKSLTSKALMEAVGFKEY